MSRGAIPDLERPAELHWRSALAALSIGRHADALEAARRARRAGAGRRVALLECEALLGLLSYGDALARAAVGLRAASSDPDLQARFRLVRADALWNMGRASLGRAEVRRATEAARTDLTRARVREAEALFSWREDGDCVEARRAARESRRLYAQGGDLGGIVRALGMEAGILRDEGRLAAAVRVASRRVEVAKASTRLDALAQARSDRGDLLAFLGRWQEAEAELDAARELFRHLGSPRAGLVAAPRRAMVDLARGDLARVRVAMEQTAGGGAPGRDPRRHAEGRLLASDLHLAAGDARLAEECACDALRLFRLARDERGSCRARVRRVHALLAAADLKGALREGRRAVREASRPDLGALAWLALGRALLRAGAPAAGAAFRRADRLCHARPALAPVARIGIALARGKGRGDPEVEEGLRALEAWGDRRVLAYCLADLAPSEDRRGPAPLTAAPSTASPIEPRPCGCGASALVDASLALQALEEWGVRWRRAMRSVQPFVRWHRSAWIGSSSLVLVEGEEEARPLPPGDVALRLAPGRGERKFVHFAEPTGMGEPTVALLGLEAAVWLPAGDGRFLYADTKRGGPPLDEAALGLLTRLARLFEPGHEEGRVPVDETGFPDIVGRSPAMQALFEQMGRVARSELAVHVVGATGTGKERVARALHRLSQRRGHAFVTVNASSVSDELFESEMFGHVRGAFTGAVADRRGHVMEAEGGTLFIDEVADLSARAQSKLLRFLQDGEFRRVGEGETRHARVRVITAANVLLSERVAAGLFREDLMYRLVSGVTLHLPPLRERGEDVLLLARHFLRVCADREGRPAPVLPAEVGRLLLAYPWPGNVRQLEGEINRLVVLAGEGPVRAEHLSPGLTGARQRPGGSTLAEARSSFERELIGRSLRAHQGNRTRTARALGITRQALALKMRRLGL